MAFFLEVFVGGLLAGVMYSLVAIGFVLIYRASGVFNFAQGSMVLFAALTFVSLLERGLSIPLSFLLTLAAMVLLAQAVQRWVLRPLVNRPPMTLFLATLGLSYVIEGAAQAVWGTQVHGLELGIPDRPLTLLGVGVSTFDLTAAGVSCVLVVGLSLALHRTSTGLALRGVAGDPLAALSIGIDLERVYGVVWAVAGFVGLVAGLLWGARLGVQFSLSLVVLKALPVLIIGGFTSVLGALVGGLIIGASEKVSEVYLGSLVGGGIESFFPYVLALLFLLVRPSGLFGEQRVERI
ncbi:MAG: branched-chain amino acid ABC transporter permease [Polyangiales bacterium]